MTDFSRYCVLDIETTVRAKEPYSWPADPACPLNKVVLIGQKYPNTPGILMEQTQLLESWAEVGLVVADRLLVGHNLKFDLRYAIRDGAADKFSLTDRHQVWDTGIAEYMITGQATKAPSLDDLAFKYLGRHKNGDMATHWAAGLDTTDVDKDVLRAYLTTDLELTEQVYLAQLKKLEESGATQLRDHIVHMSAVGSIYYAYVEHHGLPVSASRLNAALGLQSAAVGKAYDSAYQLIEIWTGLNPHHRAHYDPMTPAHVAAVVYGTPPIAVQWTEIDTTPTKQGVPGKRPRRRQQIVSCPPLTTNAPVLGKNGVPCVDERTLSDLLANAPAASAGAAYLSAALAFRAAAKLKGTYLDPSLEYLAGSGGVTLHPSINTVVTATGRTSASSPNSQNLPPEMEDCVASRYPGGAILKADFKQLEVCALAELSRDPVLIADLRAGVDVHFETGKTVYGWRTPADMTKQDRTIVKRINFLLIYGGGASAAAWNVGIPRATAAKIIEAFYDRYQGVKKWHGELINRVKQSAQVVPNEWIKSFPQKESFLSSPAGRIFRFVQRETPEWLQNKGVWVDFKPTEIVNYPVQGYATGDLVPMFFDELTPLLLNDELAGVPINVVHDAGWFDCKDDIAVNQTKMHCIVALVRLQAKHPLVVPLNIDFTVCK